MEIDKIFVLGAGTMGSGIAQVAASSGFEVTLMDIDSDQLGKARESIDRSVEKLFQKELKLRKDEYAEFSELGIDVPFSLVMVDALQRAYPCR